MSNILYHDDSVECLKQIESESVDLIYTDPPFNTGDTQKGVKGSYTDRRDDFIQWMNLWVQECHRILKPTGTMYLHLDDRNVHKARVHVMDNIFLEKNYLSTVIWSYDFGGRGKDRWPAKHDTILVYAKNVGKHIFNWDDIDRIPYDAPEMQSVGRTKEDAAKRVALGKVPTDVWQMSIVGTNSKERTGYPSQKPKKLINRIIKASSPVGGIVLDPFAGSGSTGASAAECERSFILIDSNPDAIKVIAERLKNCNLEIKNQLQLDT